MLKFNHSYNINNLTSTEDIAKELANFIKKNKKNYTIGLIGDLGAGKTTLVKYLAKHLNITKNVNSPTFVLMKVYNLTNIHPINKFVHIDAYRLNNESDLEEIGVKEYIESINSLTIIEWADKVSNLLPKNSIFIYIKSLKERSVRFSLDCNQKT